MRQPLRSLFFWTGFSHSFDIISFRWSSGVGGTNSGPVVLSLGTVGLACDIEIDPRTIYDSRVFFQIQSLIDMSQ